MVRQLIYLIFLFLLIGTNDTHAQNVALISSYEQSWSGGIAGHHGTNYRFIVDFSGFRSEPTPDTIWLEGRPYLLNKSVNMFIQPIKNKLGRQLTRYTISIGVSHDDYQYTNPRNDKQSESQLTPPRKFRGPALISYKSHGKDEYFEVKKIMSHGDPINYP